MSSSAGHAPKEPSSPRKPIFVLATILIRQVDAAEEYAFRPTVRHSKLPIPRFGTPTIGLDRRLTKGEEFPGACESWRESLITR